MEGLFVVGGSFQTANQQQLRGFRLCSVDIVRNDSLETSFEAHLEASLFFYAQWIKHLRQKNSTWVYLHEPFRHECENDEQRKVLSVLETLFHPVQAAARRGPRTLTVYHGCRASVARKIAISGFVDTASNDAGYFGLWGLRNAQCGVCMQIRDRCPRPKGSPQPPNILTGSRSCCARPLWTSCTQ